MIDIIGYTFIANGPHLDGKRYSGGYFYGCKLKRINNKLYWGIESVKDIGYRGTLHNYNFYIDYCRENKMFYIGTFVDGTIKSIRSGVYDLSIIPFSNKCKRRYEEFLTIGWEDETR